MFHTLETTWDHSARRSWTTVASFTMQAIGLSFLLLIPILTVQGPPKFTWLTHEVFSPPRGPASPPPHQGPRHPISGTEIHGNQIVAPVSFREHAIQIVDAPSALDLGNLGIRSGTERSGPGIPGGFSDGVEVAPPRPAPAPVATHPVRISYWAEGGLVYRVQPVYPPLARQARIQGPVQLRAVISKAGSIEGLTLISGHAMLSGAALAAVRQWRYRPYLLNGEPIEVETEITVNFTLTGN
jgi:periplasmic protein TonB